MAPSEEASEQCAVPASDASNFGPAVASDLKALHADLEEAKRIAATYQSELEGKASELASMTELFEKTRRHLIQLQLSVTNLRDERRRLANRAMEADALHRRLIVVTLERDRLHEQLRGREAWQA